MLDIKFIRKNPDIVKKASEDKGLKVDIEKLLLLDKKRVELSVEVEELRHQQKSANTKVAKSSGDQKLTLIKELKTVASSYHKKESKLREIKNNFTKLMLEIPNIPDPQVPVGPGPNYNKVIKLWGQPLRFNFKPKSHIELARKLDLVDFERAAKIGGFRNYILKNELAILEIALARYALDFILARGFTPMVTTSLVFDKCLYGTGWLPWHKENFFSLSGTKEKLKLAGTSEVNLVSYYAGETLKSDDLPKRFAAFSPCFRTEIGNYGKDTKGLYRVYQFNKVEQVVLCKNEKEAKRWLKEILENSEEFIQSLGLPYRVVHLSTGDMGAASCETFDIETWMPSDGNFRETHSASNLGDFQARRLNIRYKDKEGKNNFVHTLNNTLVASPRILIPLLENHQKKDGSIAIPQALHKYTEFKEIRPTK